VLKLIEVFVFITDQKANLNAATWASQRMF